MQLYNSLIRSQIDYGCFISGYGRESVLKALHSSHHSGLRISTGAFLKSPVQSLYTETNQWLLNKQKMLLWNMYITKILSCTAHPRRPLLLELSLSLTLFGPCFSSTELLAKPLTFTLMILHWSPTELVMLRGNSVSHSATFPCSSTISTTLQRSYCSKSFRSPV